MTPAHSPLVQEGHFHPICKIVAEMRERTDGFVYILVMIGWSLLLEHVNTHQNPTEKFSMATEILRVQVLSIEADGW